MEKYNTKTMKGGKLLAEGGYGCVFLPGINCDGTNMTSKKYVSKIQRFNNSAKNEIEIGKIIQEINGFNNHFSPVVKHCSIDIGKIKDDDKNKCTVFKKQKSKKFILMKMLYIDGIDFIDYMIEHKNSAQIVRNIINSYNHMLRTLSMLIGKKLIHYDLKGTNILFDNVKQVPLLIDFGLSIQIKNMNRENLRDFFYVYAPEYYVWSLEIHYLCYILNKNKEPSVSELKNIAKDFVENNKGINKIFSPDFLKQYKKKCEKQLRYYNSIEYNERVEKILNYWATFDNYSLSIMYLKFLYFINIEGFHNNPFTIFFSKLLLQNIDPDPEKRLTILQTIHTFNGFLYERNINNSITFELLAEQFVNKREKISDALKLAKQNDIKETKSMKKIFKRKLLE
jgi:serine/threonine protein kinase